MAVPRVLPVPSATVDGPVTVTVRAAAALLAGMVICALPAVALTTPAPVLEAAVRVTTRVSAGSAAKSNRMPMGIWYGVAVRAKVSSPPPASL